MADTTLGRAVLRTELDRSGLDAGLRQAGSSASTTLGQVESRAKRAGSSIRQSLTEGFSVLSQINMAGILGAGGAIYGMQALARESYVTSTGLRLLDRQMERNNITFAEGRGAVEAIAEELHVLPSTIADNVAQLLRAGLTVEEINSAFRGGAASALAFGKDATTGIDTVTNAIITGRSTLLDSIGIAQNLDMAYKEYAATLGVTTDQLTQTQRAQAAVQLITRYTKEEVEDLPLMFEGFGGAVSDLNTNLKELRIEIGSNLEPVVTTFITTVSSAVGWIAQLPEPILAAGAGAVTASVGFYALVASLGALRLVVGFLGGPAGLLITLVAAIGGVAAALLSAREETEDYEEQAVATFEALQEANTLPELQAAAESLRDAVGSSENMAAWDRLIGKMGEGKASAEELREELQDLALVEVLAPLQARLAGLNAELDRVSSEAGSIGHLLDVTETPNDAARELQELREVWEPAMEAGDIIPNDVLQRMILLEGLAEGLGTTTARRAQDEQRVNDLLADRVRIQEEIAATEAEIASIRQTVFEGPAARGGGGGGGGLPSPTDKDKADEILPPGSIAELNERIDNLKKRISLAGDDETRWVLRVELQGLEAELAEMERKIAPVSVEIRPTVNGEAVLAALRAEEARLARRAAYRRATDPWNAEGPTPAAADTPAERSRALAAVRRRMREQEEAEYEAYLQRMERLTTRQASILRGSEVTGATPGWSEYMNLMDGVREAIRDVDVQAELFGETGTELEQKMRILQAAAMALVSRGWSPQSTAVQRLLGEYRELEEQSEALAEAEREAARAVQARIREQLRLGDGTIPAPEMTQEEIDAALAPRREQMAADRERAWSRATTARISAQESLGLGNEVTGATSGWEELQELLRGVEEQLRVVDQEASIFGTTQETLESRTRILRSAIVDLLRSGYSPQSVFVQELIDQYNLFSDAADINADTLLAQQEAADRSAQAQKDLAQATASATSLLGEAPSAVETLISTLERLEASGELSAEQLEEVARLLELLRSMRGNEELEARFEALGSTITTVARALSTLLDTDWSNGNEVIEGITGAAGDLLSLIPGIGPAIGGLVKTIGSAVSSVLGDMSSGLREVEEDTRDLQRGFQLIDISELVQTRQVSRGGLLGLLGITKTVVDEDATQIGISIAESIESGVMSGLRRGMDRFLETGDIEDLELALQEGIYEGVTNALLTAIVEQGVIQSILGPSLLELSQAIAEGYETGDYSRATRILQDIQAMVPQIAQELAPIFGMIADLKPPGDDEGSRPGAPGGGRQISELTGPTRDLLTDLLTPLASLVSVPSLMRSQLRVQEEILRAVQGTSLDAPIGEPPRAWRGLLGAQQAQVPGVDQGIIIQGDLNVTTNARSARELYRELSSYHALSARGRRA